MLPSAPYLAGLLDSFVTASSVFKSFLVDKRTRAFVATDTAPVQDSIYNVLQEWVRKMGAFEGLFKCVPPSGAACWRPGVFAPHFGCRAHDR